jgi:hypothetical protein
LLGPACVAVAVLSVCSLLVGLAYVPAVVVIFVSSLLLGPAYVAVAVSSVCSILLGPAYVPA